MPPSVCLLLIGDGRRDYRARTLGSAARMLPPLDCLVEVDDTDHELGFGGAIAAGWEAVLETGADYVFHLEADFTFNVPVPVWAMVELLELYPELAQVALKRQPWNERERAAGGIVEADLDDFSEARLPSGFVYTEHSRFFTTNPSLYRAELCRRGWPDVAESEGIFTHQLLELGYRFAFWGGRLEAPRVTHIGEVRAGVGY